MEQLFADTASAAEKLFKGLPIRVWVVKLGERSWKCLIINTDNLIKLSVGPKRTTAVASLVTIKAQLESIVGKMKKAD
ncbi:hypothetical protein M0R72_00915 [Candidatus Pacearchaeota archaeon]|jgi:hypothetical protein|nr:hypothetical protein [Candidatus Pacearchaeota archaeon]